MTRALYILRNISSGPCACQLVLTGQLPQLPTLHPHTAMPREEGKSAEKAFLSTQNDKPSLGHVLVGPDDMAISSCRRHWESGPVDFCPVHSEAGEAEGALKWLWVARHSYLPHKVTQLCMTELGLNAVLPEAGGPSSPPGTTETSRCPHKSEQPCGRSAALTV